MYNKRVLSKATSELGKAKAPAKKKDIPVSPEKVSRPFVSNDGYKQGPPPVGQHYRIPSNTLYNPTPYRIKAVSDNNIVKYLEPNDTTNKVFPGAKYVDEYPAMAEGGNRGTNRALFYKRGGEKKYSRSLEAKNRLFVENPITKKKKSKKKKIFDPNAKYYQAGGSNITKLSPEEEAQFQNFYQTLPDNLMSDDPTYDMRGYWDSEGRPSEFNYNQPTEDDGYYHAYSINGNTGEYLKSPAHETFQHAVDIDRTMGYRPIPNVYGRNIVTENESLIDPQQQSFLRNAIGPVSQRDGGYINNKLPLAQLGIENQTKFPSVKPNKEKSVLFSNKVFSKDATPCGEGEVWDEVSKTCVKKDIQELPTMYASANPETNKKRVKFIDKANALWDTVEGRKVWMENGPKNYSLNELSKFVHNVKDYKDQATIYEKYRRMAENDEISGDEFARLYNENNWARFDQNTGRENFKGEYQQAVDKANERKEKNFGITENAINLLTGAGSLKRLAEDPIGTLSDAGQTIVDVAAAPVHEVYNTITGSNSEINPLTGQPYWSGSRGALDLFSSVSPLYNLANSTVRGANVLNQTNQAINTGLTATGNVGVKGVKATQNALGTIRQGLDTPISNMFTKKPMYWKDPITGGVTTQWMPGASPQFENITQFLTTPANILKAQTAIVGVQTLPHYLNNMEKDVDVLAEDPTNAEAYVDMAYNTIKQATDVAPLLGKYGNTWYGSSAPLYLGHNSKDVYDKNDKVALARGIFNISSLPRLINRKEGGDTDINKHRQLLRDWTYGADIGMLQEANGGEYWEDEIDEPTRQRLLAQGYQIEDLD